MSSIKDFIGKSAEANVRAALELARANQSYNALISLTEQRALERAKQVDAGDITGRLAGVPFAVKDNFLAFGAPTTAASKMLENFEAPLQATAVDKLEAEGAICIGKTNLDAFAHGGSTENSIYGSTKNSIDTTRVAGGSSGGSAVATALDIVPFALGSDTGGSIRQPASFNGVVGVKPTYGAVSRYGVVAMASSTDTIGCFTSNMADAELVMEIMSGHDQRDMTSLPDYWQRSDAPQKQKIGLIKELMDDQVDSAVRSAVSSYGDKLRAAGHEVVEVSLPLIKHTLAMYYIIVPAEITSNLSRYDGIRYGYRAEAAASLSELYGRSRDEGFLTENKRRIMIGNYVLSSGYFDAYYQQAQKARTLLIEEYNKLFAEFDVLLCPVAPTPAFETGADMVKVYLQDALGVGPSLAGLPAISVPAGSAPGGLPVGAQLIGQRQDDSKLLALARQIEEGDYDG